MSEPTLPEQVLLTDPLDETVRAERRGLLLVSMLAIAVVKGHLMPSRFLFAEIALSNDNQVFLLWLLRLVVGYFLAAFMLYAFSQYGLFGFTLGAANFTFARIQRDALVQAIKERPLEELQAAANVLQRAAPHGWNAAIRKAITDAWREDLRPRLVTSAFIARLIIDLILPVAVGAYAMVLLWNAQPIQPPLLAYPIWTFPK